MCSPRSATWPPTSGLYLAGAVAYSEALSPAPNSPAGLRTRSCAVGGPDPPRVPTAMPQSQSYFN